MELIASVDGLNGLSTSCWMNIFFKRQTTWAFGFTSSDDPLPDLGIFICKGVDP
jgi:hypothetical protein